MRFNLQRLNDMTKILLSGIGYILDTWFIIRQTLTHYSLSFSLALHYSNYGRVNRLVRFNVTAVLGAFFYCVSENNASIANFVYSDAMMCNTQQNNWNKVNPGSESLQCLKLSISTSWKWIQI